MYIFHWKQPSLDLQKATEIQVPVASTVQHPTGITFTGKGAASYGSVQQQNLMRLLENFADAQPPIGPTVGQLWFDSVRKSLKICVSTSPITWANASGVAVGANPPEPQLGMLWYQTMGEVSGILHIYNGLGRYGSIYENAIGGWNQVWPQVQTVAGREEYDTMRELLEQLAGQAVSSYGSGAIGRHIQDLTDFASLDNSLRQAWASKGSDEFTLLKKSGDLAIPHQALSNGTLFALADVSSPNDSVICGAVGGVVTPGQSGTIFINGTSASIPADSLPSDLQFDFAYVVYSANNVGGFGLYRFAKFENGAWFLDPANGSQWQQFTPVAGQYVIGTGASHQADDNSIYPGIKNIFMWGNAVEIVNPGVQNLKVETNSQDWDKLLAAFRYAISRLEVSDAVVQQISKMPFVRDGWQVPATIAALPNSDVRQAPIARRANQWPSIVGQISDFNSTQSAVSTALAVRHTLKGMASGATKPEVVTETLTPNLTNVFASGVGRLKLAINFDSFDDRCRFLFSGGALQLELSHSGGTLPADNNLRTVFANSVAMARFTAASTLLFTGTSPYTPGGLGNPVGLQNINDTGKVMFTKSLGGCTVTATIFRPTLTRLELQIDINAGGQLSGTTAFKVSTVRDTLTYSGSSAVYPGPNAYDASDIITFQQIDVAPTITQNPTSTTATDGQGTSFTVIASGTGPLNYDWQYNQGGGWLSLGAANSPTLSFTAALSQNGYAYRVVVSNIVGSAESSAATLTVNAAGVMPSITQQPSGQTIVAGETATLSISAIGTEPLTYQWRYSDGTPIGGATNSVLSVTPSSTSSYYCVVGNAFGTVQSNTVLISVNAAVANIVNISQVPSGSVTAGTSLTFTSEVIPGTGPGAISAPFVYNWQASVNGGASWNPVQNVWVGSINGSSTFALQPTFSDTGSQIRLVVNGSAISNSTTLAVTEQTFPAQITQQPQSSTICVGSSATFSVSASGSAPLSYQWQGAAALDPFNFSNIPGATASSITRSTTTDFSILRVIVTNPYGSETSSNATLTVNTAPIITSQPTGSDGEAVTMTVIAPDATSYQWQIFNIATSTFDNIDGATASSYSVLGNSSILAIRYRVVVSNSCGSTISDEAIVGGITVQSYTWRVDPYNVSGGAVLLQDPSLGNPGGLVLSTSPTLNTVTSITVDGTTYTRSTLKQSGTTASAGVDWQWYEYSASIGGAVGEAPTIATQPSNQSTAEGGTLTFSGTANGTEPLTYQWELSSDGVTWSNVT